MQNASEIFRNTLRWLLLKPVTWLVNKTSSAPKKDKVFRALTKLYHSKPKNKRDRVTVLEVEPHTQSFIIFSDQHKGRRNGSDDFAGCEAAYLAALDYYNQQGFHYINLGDAEELWENNIFQVLKSNKATFAAELQFLKRDCYYKIYGNHDSFWRFDPLSANYLKRMYGSHLNILSAVILKIKTPLNKELSIFCTHGNQGDSRSDNNPLSAAVVNYLWAPFQSLLRINPNTPSNSDELKTLHNQMMYEWCSNEQNTLLITGHTHQPVFESLTHLERLLLLLEEAKTKNDQSKILLLNEEILRRSNGSTLPNLDYRTTKPVYFNTGCCCFSNGHITGIEITKGKIQLVKWSVLNETSTREILESSPLTELHDLRQ